MAETATTYMDLLASAKRWLRVSASSQDDEILQTLEAGALDLETAGITADLDSAIIRQALKLYLKANYGNDANRADWSEAYEALKRSLSLTSKYGEVTGGDNGQSN